MEQYQQHIEPDAIQATPPEELHPVAAAFGGDIGAALQKTGEQVSNRIEQLAQHMNMMNYWRGQQSKQDIATGIKTQLINAQYNDKGTIQLSYDASGNVLPEGAADITNAVGGAVAPTEVGAESSLGLTPGQTTGQVKTIEVPAAIYDRTGNNAQGATQWYANKFQDLKKQAMLQADTYGLGIKNKASLNNELDLFYASQMNAISKHEAEQLHTAGVQTYESALKLDTTSANVMQDAPSMGLGLQQLNKHLDDWRGFQQLDESSDVFQEKRLLEQNKFIGNSVNAQLRSGVSPDDVNNNVDILEQKGVLDPSAAAYAREEIKINFPKMQAANQRMQQYNFLNNDVDLMTKFFSNELGPVNPADIQGLAGMTNNPETVKVLTAAIRNPSYGKPMTMSDKDLYTAVQGILETKDKQSLVNLMREHVTKYGGADPSILKTIARVAADQNQLLRGSDSSDGKNQNFNKSQMQAALKVLGNFHDNSGLSYKDAIQAFMKQSSDDGVIGSPSDAADASIKKVVTDAHPETLSTGAPNYFIGDDGQTKVFHFRPNIKVSAQYIARIAKGSEEEEKLKEVEDAHQNEEAKTEQGIAQAQ